MSRVAAAAAKVEVAHDSNRCSVDGVLVQRVERLTGNRGRAEQWSGASVASLSVLCGMWRLQVASHCQCCSDRAPRPRVTVESLQNLSTGVYDQWLMYAEPKSNKKITIVMMILHLLNFFVQKVLIPLRDIKIRFHFTHGSMR